MEKENLTREQRRMMERANKEVMQKYDAFAERFLEYFTNHEDPGSDEVLQQAKKMDAQWRVYCKGKNLKIEAYTLIKDFCGKVIEDYQKNLKGDNEPQPEEQAVFE